MKLVVFGLSLSSTWGNRHAKIFRSLLDAFAGRGHDILFLEREAPWYARNRDLADPDYCRLEFYSDLAALERWRGEIAEADAVMVASYVPQGVQVGRYIQRIARGVTAFYDIDTLVTLAKLQRCDFEYLSPPVIPGYDIYLSSTGGPTLGYIEERYGSPAARTLYPSVDPSACAPLDLPKKWDLSYLGPYGPDWQPMLDKLLVEPALRLPQRRFAVAGSHFPADWPANIERIDVATPDERVAFLSASRFTLNGTRADRATAGWTPSSRLFEAAACAVPIISDPWRGLAELFEPDREIVLAENGAQVVERLETMDRARAEAIGRAARRRVMRGHRAEDRAAELESYLFEAGAVPVLEYRRAV